MLPAAEAVELRPSVTGALTIECIDSSWGFTALRPEWNALLRDSASDCPFLTALSSRVLLFSMYFMSCTC